MKNQIIKDWKKFLKPLEEITKVKIKDPASTKNLMKIANKLPATQEFANIYDDLLAKTKSSLGVLLKNEAEEFRRIEASLIKELREKNTPLRELDNAWRIKHLCLELKKEDAEARCLYNREVIIPWQRINSVDDLKSILNQAWDLLEKSKMDPKFFEDILWNAYRRSLQNDKGTSEHQRIPIHDLYREMRLELVRHILSPKKNVSKKIVNDLPLWAFLYNLDLYRGRGHEIDQSKRLNFETGSQREHSQGMAMTLNGLKANEDYKEFCFVKSAV